MTILAIETTGKTASIAIINQEKILASINLNAGYTHSQTLLPMIDYLLRTINLDTNKIDYIACSSGPGSFTGIKIGVTTAKAFAHANNILIIDVPTLDAMALNIFAPDKIIIPIMDARRSQVYSAIYEQNNNITNRLTDYLNLSIAEIIKKALELKKSLKKDIIFLGDGVEPNKNKIMSCDGFIAPENLNLQSASSVGLYAKKMLEESKNIFSYDKFLPFYLRKTQAELEKNQKINQD